MIQSMMLLVVIEVELNCTFPCVFAPRQANGCAGWSLCPHQHLLRYDFHCLLIQANSRTVFHKRI